MEGNGKLQRKKDMTKMAMGAAGTLGTAAAGRLATAAAGKLGAAVATTSSMAAAGNKKQPRRATVEKTRSKKMMPLPITG